MRKCRVFEKSKNGRGSRMTLQKLQIQWAAGTSQWVGGPGYTSVFCNASSIAQPGPLQTFVTAILSYVPSGITLTVPNNGELIDETNGHVTGTWTTGSSTTQTATGTGSMLLTTGPQVRLETGSFRRGKHIRGRLFLVPSHAGAIAGNGYLSATTANAVQAAADTLRTSWSGQWSVWHRPLYDYTVKPPVLKVPGEILPVTSVVCPTKPASLTSRRQ
jgi:hypothetical protein